MFYSDPKFIKVIVPLNSYGIYAARYISELPDLVCDNSLNESLI